MLSDLLKLVTVAAKQRWGIPDWSKYNVTDWISTNIHWFCQPNQDAFGDSQNEFLIRILI